jgi:LOR/SDH bifunctional enzyme conserved region
MTEGRHSARLVLQGHIIDSMMLPQVMDIVMDLGGNFTDRAEGPRPGRDRRA